MHQDSTENSDKHLLAYNHFQTQGNTQYSGIRQLNDTEKFLLAYSKDIVKMFYEQLLSNQENEVPNSQILEFGAGTGFLASLLKELYGVSPTCVEIDKNLQSLILSKGFECFGDTREAMRDFSVIYTSNVLEHIEDDTTTLDELYKCLVKNGKIGIYVPALPILYSSFDAEIGHFRRYKRKELMRKVSSAGFRVEYCCYHDSLGFFASYLVKIVGYKRIQQAGSQRSLFLYDKYVFPISKLLDKFGLSRVIGKNLILIASKP